MPFPLSFRRAVNLNDQEYAARVDDGLGKALARNTETERMRLENLRVVIFSDLHRGSRDPVDDFQSCEPAYSAALGWYKRNGYQLWLLGDVEELWKNDIDEVLPAYRELLDLERDFETAREGAGLRRFYGNHDIDWSQGKFLKKLREAAGYDLHVHESLRVEVEADDPEESGTIFLVHGHQGDPASDRFLKFSRILVRKIWRKIQEAKGLISTTPAQDYELRKRHDKAMHEWAKTQRADALVLIAGHTHHPVWTSDPKRKEYHPEEVKAEIDAELLKEPAKGSPDHEKWQTNLAGLEAEWQRRLAEERRKRYDPPPIDLPCYFNTGCCCFPDRDVTAIELADGEIKLVRWLNDRGEARAECKEHRPLGQIFRAIRGT
jgi:UDP-2,3-diacylglucosamine pyrophosphatase LpxH